MDKMFNDGLSSLEKLGIVWVLSVTVSFVVGRASANFDFLSSRGHPSSTVVPEASRRFAKPAHPTTRKHLTPKSDLVTLEKYTRTLHTPHNTLKRTIVSAEGIRQMYRSH